MTIMEKIEKFRKNLGLNKTEFAKKLGLSQQNYSYYSTGKDFPASLIKKCYKELGLDLIWLFNDSDNCQMTLSLPQDTVNKRLNIINLKLNNFPLKIIVALAFILGKTDDISNKTNLISEYEKFYDDIKRLPKFKAKTSREECTAKSLKEDIVKYVNYYLTDEDVEIIFFNKSYYLEYLGFLMKSSYDRL